MLTAYHRSSRVICRGAHSYLHTLAPCWINRFFFFTLHIGGDPPLLRVLACSGYRFLLILSAPIKRVREREIDIDDIR